MIRDFISIYLPSYPTVLVYMLQSTEYEVKPYVKWVWRTKDFTGVMKRRTLHKTKAARALLLALRLGMLLEVIAGFVILYLGLSNDLTGGVGFGAALILAYPIVWAHLIIVPLALGRWFINGPTNHHIIAASEVIFANHPGVKIAVVGSYGKTTMKELLNTVLSEGLKVAATPANKNVSSSHAKFAGKLQGDENVLIIEYGEGAPGDVKKFAQLTHPSHAVITGVSPAHLDKYKTLHAAGKDIFSVAKYVNHENVYVNDESPESRPFIKKTYHLFDTKTALGWKVDKIEASLEGTSFNLTRGKQTLELKSGLVGQHQVAFLAFVAAFALELGLTEDQVKAGIAKTKPFEHRMQPYRLADAWIVDDTYNGNLEGLRAGTKLLSDLTAKRKIYVTPGLVDQGEETERVHVEAGKLIAAAHPDLVVLMQNSVTDFIKSGLKQAKFKGELRVEPKPLDFYTNLSHFVASGDLVVMQNDWTDNYA
ncbi:MAG TPA: Mur ligase family protein [Methylomirabilota bacterium]|nr:Mur ligase family protein [Methylomirabilota bacterium]